MTKYRMLDLFCGLGGASQAMVDHEDWEVVRIDNNPDLLQHVSFVCKDIRDVLEEVRQLKPNQIHDIDLIWASPPCTDFSNGYAGPKYTHMRENPDEVYLPDLTLVRMTIEIIEILKPRYWIIENVKGAVKFFEPLLGPPKVIIGPYYLWGNFPLFNAKLPAGYSKYNDEDKYGRKLRPNARAVVPIEISEALRQTIQYQSTLDNYRMNINSD